MQLVLASSSPYRRQLLERLQLPFECAAPDIDESPLPGEAPVQLVTRLARAKAAALAGRYPHALIIGSDQVAVLGDRVLGKPGSHANAVLQLQQCSGRRVTYHTGLCLLDAARGDAQVDCIDYALQFRQLSDAQIERYLQREQPYNTAGSIKSEALGIVLFESMHGDDPTALIGLPLIRLTSMLLKAGIGLP